MYIWKDIYSHTNLEYDKKEMYKYFENLNETVKEYSKVLSDEIPDFLYDYKKDIYSPDAL